MFSERFRKYAEEQYQRRLLAHMFGELAEEITSGITRLEAYGLESREAELALLMKFFYGTMPLCDAGDHDFSVFLDYAAHGLWLREEFSWCRELPEDLFLRDVLYYRVNTEGITPCRKFFYRQLEGRIQGRTPVEIVLEVNDWCAQQAGYEASDDRTLSPMAVYHSGSGRCGEESVFVVSALRSVGIPARQVYVPWWGHCDDNHAWVEVYVEGGWHFLGACEPEETLDQGWFVGAASRALLVHSRAFFDYPFWGDEAREDCIGRVGNVWYYNRTQSYTKTKELEILVKDRSGRPAGQARVSIETLNMSDYRRLAELVTDERGRTSISIGLGDIHICAGRDGWIGEIECLKAKESRVVLTLDRRRGKQEAEVSCCEAFWEAPQSVERRGRPLTREQRSLGRERRQRAEEVRKKRQKERLGCQDASVYAEQEILEKAGGNIEELCRFLSAGCEPERRKLLRSLADKDYRDVTADILEAFLENPRGEWGDRKLWDAYVLCPRIGYEELTPYPPRIRAYFTNEQKERFREEPKVIWDYIQEKIREDETETYPALPGTPVGCLRLGRGSALGRKSLFVAIARSLGIPSRLNPVDGTAEFWHLGGFVPAERERQTEAGSLVLEAEAGAGWVYSQNYSLAKFSGDCFLPLRLEEVSSWRGRRRVELGQGWYRLITANRLPNGSQHMAVTFFQLEAGREQRIFLSVPQGELRELLCRNELEDFEVEGTDGEKTLLSSLLPDDNGLLVFLEVGQEPTEHVLNEMLQQKERIEAQAIQILFLLEKKQDLENERLLEVLKALPKVQIGLDPGFSHAEQIARDMYVETEKMPLLVAVRPWPLGILGLCGYHVGSVELITKILQLEAEPKG